MRLAKECQKCNKFSHCNNNDLFCQKFITQELQTAKEENEQTYQTLFEQVQSCFEYPDLEEDLSIGEILTLNQETLDIYAKKIGTLTQQNKQMMGALEKIDGDCHFTKECAFNHNCHKCHVAFYKNIAFDIIQALKGVE